MRNLKTSAMVLTLASAATLAGCSKAAVDSNTAANGTGQNTSAGNNAGAGESKYPQTVADEFVKACEGAGAKRDLCQCVFEKVEQKYSFEEFSEIGTKINAGEPPAEFVEFSDRARVECLK